MALWTGNLEKVNEGFAANDGTGDSIRNAFIKNDGNFQSVNAFLSQPTIQFTRVKANLEAVTANISTIYANSLTVASETITANASIGQNLSVGLNFTAGGTVAANGVYNAGNLIVLGSSQLGDVTVQGNLVTGGTFNAAGSIVPSANLQYDLGSPTNFFRNVYSQGLVEVNTVVLNNNDNILRLHSNIPAGDVKDVGILGEFNKNSINNYAYFGYQYATDNFVYKITPTDATQGSGIVTDGVYGAAQFGSLFLSNISSGNTLVTGGGASIGGNIYGTNLFGNITGQSANVTDLTVTNIITNGLSIGGSLQSGPIAANGSITTTSTVTTGGDLFVAGNITNTGGISSTANITTSGLISTVSNVAGNYFLGNVSGTFANIGNLNLTGNVTGNLNVDGAIRIGAAQILTTSNVPYYGTLYAGGVINGDAQFISGTPSTSVTTGAVTIPFGGLGVYGNIVAGGFVGPYYGNVVNPVQTGITTLGTLGNLYVTGTTNTGVLQTTTIGATNATITGNLDLTGSTISGNLTVPNLDVTGRLSAGSFAVTTLSLTTLAVSGNTIVNNLAVLGTITTGSTITTSATSNALSSGNITVTGNVTTSNLIATSGIYSDTYRFANGSPFVSTTLANTAEITANLSSGTNAGLSLTATGVTAGTYGSATSIPTIVVDSKGRVQSLTANAVSTTINLSGTSGTGNVAGGGTLTFAGTYGVTAAASASTITVGTPQDLRTTAAPTFAGATVNGTVSAINVNAGTVGNVGSVVIGTLNTAAQPNITSVGTLTGLTVSAAIVPSANASINIGSTSAWFGTVYGKASQAQYADLAEIYTSDAEYEPGTVVVFGGDAEITVTNKFADVSIAGAISTDPAYLMNAEAVGLPVALRGRIPVKVIGPVEKGDLLVTAGDHPGYAISIGHSTNYPLAVFAKAIETDTAEGKKVITAVII